MRQYLIITILLLFVAVSCDEPTGKRPEKLIKEKKMVDMLVDVHLAESAYYDRANKDSLVMKTTPTDFYYSILDKHQVPDSVFEQSFIYYTSNPKNFEKMYRQVMNRLSEMEQEFSGRKNEPLQFENEN